MMQQIKNYVIKNWRSILICFIIVFFIAIPLLKARAGFFDDVASYTNEMLNGLEEVVGPIAIYYIIFFFTYIFNVVFVYASSIILQYIVDNRQWLTIQNSALVQSGYHFTAGLTNLFLILIFVIIAISYILKIESFQAQKSLARLVVVALLMNFSLVLIGALVDIFNVVYNTILTAGGPGFVTNLVSQLAGGGFVVVALLVVAILGLITTFSIPVANLVAQVTFGIFMVTAGLPSLIMWIFQIIVFMMMGGIFITYAFLFAARVFVIQILAALAPLAFLCLILPQTRRYWDDWLKHLLAWLSLGVIVLLFLVIGSKITGQLTQPNAWLVLPGIGFLAALANPTSVITTFSFYLFVFVYLVVVLFMSRKAMPEFATFLINQTQAAFGQAQKLAKPLFEATYKQTRELAQSPGGVEDRFRRRMEQTRFAAWVGGPGAMDAVQAKRTAAAAKSLEGRNPVDLRKMIESRGTNYNQKVGALAELARQGKFDYKKTDPETKRYVEMMQKAKVDMKLLTLGNRPDLSPFVWDREHNKYFTTEGSISRMDPGTLRSKVDPEAFKDPEVVAAMNWKQFEQIAKRGSQKQKNAIRDQISDVNKRREIGKVVRATRTAAINARAAGDIEEATRLEDEYKRSVRTLTRIVMTPTFNRNLTP